MLSPDFARAIEREIADNNARIEQLETDLKQLRDYRDQLATFAKTNLGDDRHVPPTSKPGPQREDGRKPPTTQKPRKPRRTKKGAERKPHSGPDAERRARDKAALLDVLVGARWVTKAFLVKETGLPVNRVQVLLREMVGNEILAEGATVKRRYRHAKDDIAFPDGESTPDPEPAPAAEPTPAQPSSDSSPSIETAKPQPAPDVTPKQASKSKDKHDANSAAVLKAITDAGAAGIKRPAVAEQTGLDYRIVKNTVQRLAAQKRVLSDDRECDLNTAGQPTDPENMIYRLSRYGIAPADDDGAKTTLERDVVAALRALGTATVDGPDSIHSWLRDRHHHGGASNGAIPNIRSLRTAADGLFHRGVLNRSEGRYQLVSAIPEAA